MCAERDLAKRLYMFCDGHDLLAWRQDSLPVAGIHPVGPQSEQVLVAPTQQPSAGWHALRRRGVPVREPGTLVKQFIKNGRDHIGVYSVAEVSEAVVVRQHQQNVGTARTVAPAVVWVGRSGGARQRRRFHQLRSHYQTE